MIKRFIDNLLHQKLKQAPAVALLGARQVGKTTLAKTLVKQSNAIYLDLESPLDLLKLEDALGFLSSQNNRLLILDEIQRVPELFSVMRGVIDRRREQGESAGQFLLLGSASMDLLRQSSESLAGRISYLEMSGMHALEIERSQQSLQQLWLRGGFPNSYLADTDDVAMDWLEDLIRSYLERDIPALGFNIPSVRLKRLWTMLSHLQGEPANVSQLAANFSIRRGTLDQYIDILNDLFLLRRLEPWYANVKKRLVKSPRYYVRDSGLLHKLLGIHDFGTLLSSPVLGKSWEGFVIENILAVLPSKVETYYYRTAAGLEIDLLIRWSASEVWAVEIKYGSAPKLNKHFQTACEDVEATRAFVIYSGQDTFDIRHGVTMMPLVDFMHFLVNHSS